MEQWGDSFCGPDQNLRDGYEKFTPEEVFLLVKQGLGLNTELKLAWQEFIRNKRGEKIVSGFLCENLHLISNFIELLEQAGDMVGSPIDVEDINFFCQAVVEAVVENVETALKARVNEESERLNKSIVSQQTVVEAGGHNVSTVLH